MDRSELVAYIDGYLSIGDIEDYPGAMNGLQVEGADKVERIVTAVDATEASIRASLEGGAGMLVVHHGLFWAGLGPITGRTKQRLALLITGDISLYSAHLPLDAHETVGNNAVLARMLELDVDSKFGDFKGTLIGVSAEVAEPVSKLSERVGIALGVTPRLFAFGPDTTRRVAVVTGGAGSAIAQAAAQGVDTLVTGEVSHPEYLDAEEYGINIIAAGHYATETVGVRALGDHLSRRFSLEHAFFDHPTGL